MKSKVESVPVPAIKSRLEKAQKDKDKIKTELEELYKELQERAQRCVISLEHGIEPTSVLLIAANIERKKEVFKQVSEYVNTLCCLNEEVNQIQGKING